MTTETINPTRKGDAMKPEWKEKWVKALRSGQYAQTSGMLHSENPNGAHSYCCLGVLLDISDIGHFEGPLYHLEECDAENRIVFCGGELESLTGYFEVTLEQQNKLVQMNDENGNTFAEIADYIESAL